MGYTSTEKWVVVQTTPIGSSTEAECRTQAEAIQTMTALKICYPDRDYVVKQETEYSMQKGAPNELGLANGIHYWYYSDDDYRTTKKLINKIIFSSSYGAGSSSSPF